MKTEEKGVEERDRNKEKFLVEHLREMLQDEKGDTKSKGNLYSVTQKLMAYHNNAINGNITYLDMGQVMFLYDTGLVVREEDVKIPAEEVEKIRQHFVVFRYILESLDVPLSFELLWDIHSSLKVENINTHGMEIYRDNKKKVETMLYGWYAAAEKNFRTMAELLSRLEAMDLFQTYSGQAERLILFRECLKYGIMPPIIRASAKDAYHGALKKAETGELDELMSCLQAEQAEYRQIAVKFLKEQ
jgi:hypothetical protein